MEAGQARRKLDYHFITGKLYAKQCGMRNPKHPFAFVSFTRNCNSFGYCWGFLHFNPFDGIRLH